MDKIETCKKTNQTVCEWCCYVAWCNGFEELEGQMELMLLIGRDIEDHLCEAREKPNTIECYCACNTKDIREINHE